MRTELPPLMITPHHRVQPEATILDILLLAGCAFEVAAGEIEAARAATRTALAGWIALGLGYARAADGTRLFDPVEVVNFAKSAGFKGDDTFWEAHLVRTGRALVSSLENESGMSLGKRASSSWSHRTYVRIERSFNPIHFPPDRKLRLKLPLPLTGRYADDVTIAADAVGVPGATAVVLPGRLEVVLPAGSEVKSLVLAADLGFNARDPLAGALDEPPTDIYLRPHEGMIQVTERVRLEASARARDLDPVETVKAYWSYLIDEFACGPMHYDQIGTANPMDWVLDHRWYDCQLGAALLASLCRAVGIPARLVGGYVLYRLAPTNHFWAEVWLPEQGWLPFDFLAWDLSLGGKDTPWRDVFFGESDARMLTECYPHQFSGSMTLTSSMVRQLLQTKDDKDLVIRMYDVSSRSMIYKDRIIIK